MYRGNLHYRNWFLTWPGVHGPLWGLPERSPWTVGAPIELHPVYPHALYGAPEAGLWQSLLVLGALGPPGDRLGRLRRAARPGPPGRPPSVVSGATQPRPWPRAARAPGLGSALAVLVAWAGPRRPSSSTSSFHWALPCGEGSGASARHSGPDTAGRAAAIVGPSLAAGPWPAASRLARARRAVLRAAFLAWSGTLLGGPVLYRGRARRTACRPAERAGAWRRRSPASGRSRGRRPPPTSSWPRTADFATWHAGEARGFWLLGSGSSPRRPGWPDGCRSGRAKGMTGRLRRWAVDGGPDHGGPAVPALPFHELAFPAGGRPSTASRPRCRRPPTFRPGSPLWPPRWTSCSGLRHARWPTCFGVRTARPWAPRPSPSNPHGGRWVGPPDTPPGCGAALLGAGALVALVAGVGLAGPPAPGPPPRPGESGWRSTSPTPRSPDRPSGAPHRGGPGPQCFLDARPLTVLPADRPQRECWGPCNPTPPLRPRPVRGGGEPTVPGLLSVRAPCSTPSPGRGPGGRGALPGGADSPGRSGDGAPGRHRAPPGAGRATALAGRGGRPPPLGRGSGCASPCALSPARTPCSTAPAGGAPGGAGGRPDRRPPPAQHGASCRNGCCALEPALPGAARCRLSGWRWPWRRDSPRQRARPPAAARWRRRRGTPPGRPRGRKAKASATTARGPRSKVAGARPRTPSRRRTSATVSAITRCPLATTITRGGNGRPTGGAPHGAAAGPPWGGRRTRAGTSPNGREAGRPCPAPPSPARRCAPARPGGRC